MNRMYMLAYDATKSGNDIKIIRAYMIDNKYIDGWSNHLPGMWMFISTLSARELREKMDFLLTPRYLIVEINIGNSDGQMPSEAWDWIHSHNNLVGRPSILLPDPYKIHPER